MSATFAIHYHAPIGRRLQLVDDTGAFDLHWTEGDWWTAVIDREVSDYRYRIVDDDGVVEAETGPPRRLAPVTAPTTMVDRYRPHDSRRAARQSALFSRALSYRHDSDLAPSTDRVTFRLLEPWIEPGLHPAIVGDGPDLGEWDVARAVPMVPAPFPWWQAGAAVSGRAEYKFVVLDDHGDLVAWEDGPNRVVPDVSGRVRVSDDELRGVSPFRGAGIAVPVFSLRTDADVGVGQFTDLKPLADWASDVGLSVIQLLPVNDTILHNTWQDSYPYNPTSVQALHPVYVDLDAIEGAGIAEEVAEARALFADASDVDYPAVVETKMALLRSAFATLRRGLDRDDGFASFVDDEWDWLGPYSLWAALRDRHGTPDSRQWGVDRVFDPDRLERASAPTSDLYEELQFHWFVQHHLRSQLTAAANHARSRGVALKGDLPIGVAPESVDVWKRPDLFNVGMQTGAPPDAFAVRGQNWRFPTYAWDQMAAEDHRWWRDRFGALAEYVDAYRIDHVLGFFRIWEIPPAADDGLLGHFRPSLPLSDDEVRTVLGDVDPADLARPIADPEMLEPTFGAVTQDVRSRFLRPAVDGLRLAAGFETQRAILDHFELDDGGDADDVVRGLLDIAADVLLLHVDGGYHPRIEWQATTHYGRLDPDTQARFDVMAVDFFHHRHREQWSSNGSVALAAITGSTDLLTCGEDLGMVPDFVPPLMNELGLLSLEIERMPKRLGSWIADPGDSPYLSVVSPGTHDTKPLRLWWRDAPDTAQRIWSEVLGRSGEAPSDLTPDVAEHLLRRQLESPAMLAIIPVADLLAIDGELRDDDPGREWINDPSDRRNKWRYRMHLNIDELRSADRFNAWVAWMVRSSGR